MLNLIAAMTCVIVYSAGPEVSASRALRHEMAHCWGWEDDGRIDPPVAYTMLGIYPKVVYPCGRPCKEIDAMRLCTGHHGCERERYQ